jgi:hypothetical protein
MPAGAEPYGIDFEPVMAGSQLFAQLYVTSGVRPYTWSAGPDGVFGTGDDPAAAVPLPAPPRHPGPFHPSALKASGRTLIFSDQLGFHLVDAGPDGVLATSDDRWRQIGTTPIANDRLAVSGSTVAWIAPGTPGGDQIWTLRAPDGRPAQVTFSASPKSGITVDAAGRVLWLDGVTSPELVMQYQP